MKLFHATVLFLCLSNTVFSMTPQEDNIFGIPAETLISTLQKDRLHGEHKHLVNLITSSDEWHDFLPNNGQPLKSLVYMIISGDWFDCDQRNKMADSYISKYKDDARFEKAYAYLKYPHILIAHVLIMKNSWASVNPENTGFYDDQIAGLFFGTMAFDKGDIIDLPTLKLIQANEEVNARFPVISSGTLEGEFFTFKKWHATSPMYEGDALDRLFINERRIVQKDALRNYVQKLEESVIEFFDYNILNEKLGLNFNSNERLAIVVAGPYGSGKSTFVKSKLGNSKNGPTSFNIDNLNLQLCSDEKSYNERKQDHHFEAMMLNNNLAKLVDNIPVILSEVAAIDEYRFNNIFKLFEGRRVIIIEIAPKHPEEAVSRLLEREGIDSSAADRIIGITKMAAENALKFRNERIDYCKSNTKDYLLYCNEMTKTKTPNFILVDKITQGHEIISDDQEELLNILLQSNK